MVIHTFFFFFNRHCNPRGFWPAQLSLSILSRKVFTEWRCQRHVKPPNLEDQWLERSNSRHQVFPTSETTRANPSSGRWNYGREICREFCRKWRLPRHVWVLLHKFTTLDRRIYFPSEGRRAEDFFARKIRRLRPDLNPRTWVPEASTLTSRPPKPLLYIHCAPNYHTLFQSFVTRCTYMDICWRNSWSETLLQLTAIRLPKKFNKFYVNRNFITAFTKAENWS